MTRNESNKRTDIPFHEFQMWGVLVGGLLPIAILGIIALVWGVKDLTINKVAGILIIVFVIAIAIVAFALYHNEREHRNSILFGLALLGEAVLSCVLTFLLIHFTGGSKDSVFSFICLYLPSIVGYAYGKRGTNLIIAAVAMFIIYIINLKYCYDVKTASPNLLISLTGGNFNKLKPLGMEVMYGIIFSIQLLVVFKIATKKSEVQSQDNIPKDSQ